MDQIKRGSYVRDTRTRQVVKIAEYGRGNDVMVKPAYKTDGYWVSRTDLERATDPHAWTWWTFTKSLVALALTVLIGYAVVQDLTRHGLSTLDAFAYSIPQAAVALVLLNVLFGISRN